MDTDGVGLFSALCLLYLVPVLYGNFNRIPDLHCTPGDKWGIQYILDIGTQRQVNKLNMFVMRFLPLLFNQELTGKSDTSCQKQYFVLNHPWFLHFFSRLPNFL
ncbi:hypothetical protein GOODEAATRI_024504 [Goodea atripinnis]|uniref:Uncharacterized protein n=1 Tax=Goodea atripinnis TaxID=208336 RepID=A0ABV0MMB6_9TELE